VVFFIVALVHRAMLDANRSCIQVEHKHNHVIYVMFKNNDTNTSFGWYYGPPKSKKCKKKIRNDIYQIWRPQKVSKMLFFQSIIVYSALTDITLIVTEN
jgi:hypothetical protein